MAIKVVTYTNPFDIQSDYVLASYPHLCVSDTLKQGLRSVYLPDHFGYMITLDKALDIFYEEWSSTANSIKRFVGLYDGIDKITDNKLRDSCRFNQREILKSVEWLVQMRIAPGELAKVTQGPEQQALLTIYQEVHDRPEWGLLDIAEQKDASEVMEQFRSAMSEQLMELTMAAAKATENAQQSSKAKRIASKIKREAAALEKLLVLWDKAGGHPGGVVVHGVHQFTPRILRWFFFLDRIGLDVVLLHNKLSQFPDIYRTWDEVTKWVPIKEVDSWTLSEMRCACASMDMEDDYKRAYQTLVEMKGEK